VRADLLAEDLDVRGVMDDIWNTISFGVGRRNDEPVRDAPVFDSIAHSPVAQQRSLLSLAKAQLGTVGSGNHYVDLLEDRADGRLWVGVHFGSRGFGHKTASGFLALANGRTWGDRVNDSMDAPPATIQLGTPLADDYLAAMNVAGEYAYAGQLILQGVPPYKEAYNMKLPGTYAAYAVTIPQTAASPAAAETFVRLLLSEKGTSIFERAGFHRFNELRVAGDETTMPQSIRSLIKGPRVP